MNTLGNQAEKVALSYLEQHGLTLIKKNYQTRLGEIDLIMKDGKSIVFVEVRLRKK
jgi:putative endonuclease